MRFASALGVLLATCGAGLAEEVPAATSAPQPADQRWFFTTSSEVRYYSWDSERAFPPSGGAVAPRGHGSLWYTPYAAQLVGKPHDDFKIEFLGRGGWVKARQTSFGASGEVETATDSQASATATYLGFNGIQPFASVSFNLPTGKSVLTGSERNARMDPDLVELGSFGEGYNVGPTGGVALALMKDLVLTTSVGHTRRGSFNRDGTPDPLDPSVVAPVRYNPGDVLTATASLAFKIGQLSADITGSVSREGETTIDGKPMVEPGQRWLASGTFVYAWAPGWGESTFSASYTQSGKNKVQFVDTATLQPVAFMLEPFNSNSNVWKLSFEHVFPIGQFWVGPTASYLQRDRNAYDPITLQFIPAKERRTFGAVARIAPNDHISFNARVERIWVKQKENLGDAQLSLLLVEPSILSIPGVPAISSDGWQFSGGTTITF
jgi:hypothetical protein